MATLRLSTNEQNFINGLNRATGAVGTLAGTINANLSRSFQNADFYSRNFDRGIGRLSEGLRSFGLAASVGVTLPLALLARSASSAYAELDSLKKGLSSLEPTAVGLSSRLAELKEIARMPGIGFQEAIQGDIRLRSVGIQAEMSTKILKEFANAIAKTGGGKDQLREVTVQLGQMAAKGVVLSQDLRPIIEQAPAVATALKSIFGTVSSDQISDQLSKQGKGSIEMIQMLLTELEKAPRVAGGWKNAMENLSDTLFVSKATIFGVADKVFDLSGKIAVLEQALKRGIEGFENLSEPTQKLILGITVLVGLMGPLSIGIGYVISAITKLTTGIGLANLGYGALVVGILAAVAALTYITMQTAEYNEAMEDAEATRKRAISSAQSEIDHVNILAKTYIDAKSSLNQKKAAKEELIKINPEFQKILKGEKTDLDALKGAIGRTADEYIRLSRTKLIQKKLDTLIQDQDDLRNNKLPLSDELRDDVILDRFGIGEGRKQVLYDRGFNNQKRINELSKELVEVQGSQVIKINESTSSQGSFTKSVIGTTDAIKKAQKEREDYAERIEKAQSEDLKCQNDLIDAEQKRLDTHTKFVEKYQEGILKRNAEKEQDSKKETDKWVNDEWEKTAKEYQDGVDKIAEINKELNTMMQDAGVDLITGIVSGEGINAALKRGLTAFGNYAVQMGKQMLPIVALIEKLKIKPGVGTAMALIGGGIALKAIASSIKVPAFAQGGMVTNPMLSMIGDNASGKEMVLPFERTSEFANMISKSLSVGDSSSQVLMHRIKGEDIELILERRKRAR